jgi:FixJ family two-component response regulator
MSCTEESEAHQIGHALLQQKTGVLITYRSAMELIHNAPSGAVAMVILAGRECPTEMREVFGWLKRRHPHCPVAVIADTGAGEEELAARVGGAIFMTRPVDDAQWSALLTGVAARGLQGNVL